MEKILLRRPTGSTIMVSHLLIYSMTMKEGSENKKKNFIFEIILFFEFFLNRTRYPLYFTGQSADQRGIRGSRIQ